jgi:hypothetical protein
VRVADVISLLAYAQAEMWDIAYVNPVNGRHLTLNRHPNVGKHPHSFYCVAGPRKCRGSRGNLVAMLNAS